MPEVHASDEEFSVDLRPLAAQLPAWMYPEQIGIDLDALTKVCRLARIRHLRVSGVQEAGADYVVGGICSGWNGRGHGENGKTRASSNGEEGAHGHD